jgi:protein SCO1/2
MLRTALASALLLLCGWAAGAWLTLDYEVWTDEGARRLQVAIFSTPAAKPCA